MGEEVTLISRGTPIPDNCTVLFGDRLAAVFPRLDNPTVLCVAAPRLPFHQIMDYTVDVPVLHNERRISSSPLPFVYTMAAAMAEELLALRQKQTGSSTIATTPDGRNLVHFNALMGVTSATVDDMDSLPPFGTQLA